MSKYIDSEKLIAEIEKRQEELSDHNFHNMAEEYDNVLGIITSLQQEQPSLPSNLGEAAEEATIKKFPDEIDLDGDMDTNIWYKQHVKYWRVGFKDGFKTGAEWMAEQGITKECVVEPVALCNIYGESLFTAGDLLWLEKEFDTMSGDRVIVQIRKAKHKSITL